MNPTNSPHPQQAAKLSRRGLLKTTGALLASAAAAQSLSAQSRKGPRLVYVGGYSGNIYTLLQNTRTGALAQIGETPAASPSFLTFNKQKTFLYAINEIAAGTASAYKVNGDTGELTFINSVPCANTPAAANGPAHVSVDASGKFLLTSQYGGASLSAIPILPDGSLGPVTDTILHTGNLGPNQTQAHPHMTVSDPSGKYVISQDLGQDRTYIYTLDTTAGKLSPGPMPFVASQPGSGPRHLAFHPDGMHMYSICELGGIVNVFFWDSTAGTLQFVQSVSTLPKGYSGRIQCSEIQVSADGNTVYAGNRGFDSVAAFSVTEFGETLAQARPRWTWTRGQTPRFFNLDPSGQFLYAANQDCSNITTFSVNPFTGDLKFENQFLGVGSPSHILFL